MSEDKTTDQQPEHPDFWCKRFREGTTPWDAGGVPAAFAAFVAHQPAPLRTLIPGCGRAWEAAYLARRGWPLTALDFSPQAVAAAQSSLVQQGVIVDLVCADFFSYVPPQAVGLIYERAFLCALPRRFWDAWGRQVTALLAPGGLLAGCFFVCDQVKGPPFGISQAELDTLLAGFECVEDESIALADSIAVFAGRERWQVWRRRGG